MCRFEDGHSQKMGGKVTEDKSTRPFCTRMIKPWPPPPPPPLPPPLQTQLSYALLFLAVWEMKFPERLDRNTKYRDCILLHGMVYCILLKIIQICSHVMLQRIGQTLQNGCQSIASYDALRVVATSTTTTFAVVPLRSVPIFQCSKYRRRPIPQKQSEALCSNWWSRQLPSSMNNLLGVSSIALLEQTLCGTPTAATTITSSHAAEKWCGGSDSLRLYRKVKICQMSALGSCALECSWAIFHLPRLSHHSNLLHRHLPSPN